MNKYIIAMLCLVVLSCKKNKDISIHSLGKAGEEFYYGERVPVWAITEGDKSDISYEWSATGGSFDGYRTQHLFENLWIAPDAPGDYTVTARVKDGGSKSTTLKVTRYFFDEFQSVYTMNGNGWAASNADNKVVTDNDVAKCRLELTATSNSVPNVRRSLNLAELTMPFSVRTKLGWKTYFRPNGSIALSLFFNQPANPTYPYLREIRWEVWPTVDATTTDNYQVYGFIFTPSTNTSGLIPLANPVKGKWPALAMAKDAIKNLSFSVDAGQVFHAYIEGNLWFTSNAIKDWLAQAKVKYPGFEEPVAKEYRVTFPAKDGSNAGSVMVMKSVYINNNGDILK